MHETVYCEINTNIFHCSTISRWYMSSFSSFKIFIIIQSEHYSSLSLPLSPTLRSIPNQIFNQNSPFFDPTHFTLTNSNHHTFAFVFLIHVTSPCNTQLNLCICLNIFQCFSYNRKHASGSQR